MIIIVQVLVFAVKVTTFPTYSLSAARFFATNHDLICPRMMFISAAGNIYGNKFFTADDADGADF